MDLEQGYYNPGNQPTQNVDVKLNIWSIKRTLFIIACIDVVFNLLSGLLTGSPFYLVISLIILVGVYGIKSYKYCLSCFYGIYLLFQIISRFVLMFYIKNSLLIILLSYFIIIFDLWIFWLLKKFLTNLKLLNNTELAELQDGWKPIIYTVVYY